MWILAPQANAYKLVTLANVHAPEYQAYQDARSHMDIRRSGIYVSTASVEWCFLLDVC